MNIYADGTYNLDEVKHNIVIIKRCKFYNINTIGLFKHVGGDTNSAVIAQS